MCRGSAAGHTETSSSCIKMSIRPQWVALHVGAGNLWPPELRAVGPDSLVHIDFTKAQGTFSQHAAQARFDALPARQLPTAKIARRQADAAVSASSAALANQPLSAS
jgi:hypothetical protein